MSTEKPLVVRWASGRFSVFASILVAIVVAFACLFLTWGDAAGLVAGPKDDAPRRAERATSYSPAAAAERTPKETGRDRPAPAGDSSHSRLSHCLVSLVDEVQVPAQEPGVIISLDVHEGMQVTAGAVLGYVDDSQPRMQRRAALADHMAAREKAESDVDIRYAKAASKVAEAEYLKAVDAERKVTGAIGQVELNRLQLTWKRAQLEIEQAQLNQKLAGYTAQTKATEVDAADEAIARRQITAPIDGVVVELAQHVGEWVKPGDPVLRIMRMNRLRVEGFLNVSQHSPTGIAQRSVSVEIELAGGRRAQFPGKIVFVSPRDEAGGEYFVWAEVDNRKENDQWLLRPGANAEMTIDLR